MAAEIDSPGRRATRCARCTDVIGVYEPLVHVLGGTVRHTSRAAEPAILTEPGRFYHEGCYEPDGGD